MTKNISKELLSRSKLLPAYFLIKNFEMENLFEEIFSNFKDNSTINTTSLTNDKESYDYSVENNNLLYNNESINKNLKKINDEINPFKPDDKKLNSLKLNNNEQNPLDFFSYELINFCDSNHNDIKRHNSINTLNSIIYPEIVDNTKNKNLKTNSQIFSIIKTKATEIDGLLCKNENQSNIGIQGLKEELFNNIFLQKIKDEEQQSIKNIERPDVYNICKEDNSVNLNNIGLIFDNFPKNEKEYFNNNFSTSNKIEILFSNKIIIEKYNLKVTQNCYDYQIVEILISVIYLNFIKIAFINKSSIQEYN